MKTELFFSLLITGTAFSQSKKDLKAQVASYQQKLDSTNLVLEKTQRSNDSLSSGIWQKENALQNKQAALETKTKELEIIKVQIESLNIQIENLKSSQKEEPAAKLPKMKPRDDNPFGTGGGNGSGNRSHLIGNDNARHLIKYPETRGISSKEACRLVFQVVVNENGEIIGMPAVIKTNTTTSDTVLIQKVSAIIKSQAKYNPLKKGSQNTTETIVIQIKPN
jgi:hypothetical protein